MLKQCGAGWRLGVCAKCVECILPHTPACRTLQHLPPEAPQMFVTLNPPQPPAPDKTIRRLALEHPVYR
jgi:hypothetical protein